MNAFWRFEMGLEVPDLFGRCWKVRSFDALVRKLLYTAHHHAVPVFKQMQLRDPGICLDKKKPTPNPRIYTTS